MYEVHIQSMLVYQEITTRNKYCILVPYNTVVEVCGGLVLRQFSFAVVSRDVEMHQ